MRMLVYLYGKRCSPVLLLVSRYWLHQSFASGLALFQYAPLFVFTVSTTQFKEIIDEDQRKIILMIIHQVSFSFYSSRIWFAS